MRSDRNWPIADGHTDFLTDNRLHRPTIDCNANNGQWRSVLRYAVRTSLCYNETDAGALELSKLRRSASQNGLERGRFAFTSLVFAACSHRRAGSLKTDLPSAAAPSIRAPPHHVPGCRSRLLW